jgi:hypothetical protein
MVITVTAPTAIQIRINNPVKKCSLENARNCLLNKIEK